jgi:hypothetical protein
MEWLFQKSPKISQRKDLGVPEQMREVGSLSENMTLKCLNIIL